MPERLLIDVAHRALSARRPGLLAVATVGVLALAGCSDEEAMDDPPEESISSPSAHFAGTPREYAEAIAACMAEQGWEGTVRTDYDGRPVTEYDGITSSELRRSFDEAGEICGERVPPRPPPDVSPAGLAKQYQGWARAHACLADAGYEVGELPTEETWLAVDAAGQQVASPHDLISGPDQAAAFADCPIDPDVWQ